jgi:competence protein ComEC
MPHISYKKISQTWLLTVSCFGVLAGIALARKVTYPSGLLCLGFVGLSLLYLPKKNLKTLTMIAVAGLFLGLWRGQAYMLRLADYQKLFRKPIIVSAVADNDAIYGKLSQLSFDVTHVVTSDHQVLVGKIKVEGLGASMVYRGDKLQISGSLAPTKGSAQARLSFAKIKVIGKGNSPIDVFRRRFIAGLESVLPEPEASFGAGLLIGQRSTIPKDINDQLSITGLTHLVAVSGYNLTIIIVAVRQVLGKGSKFQSTLAAASLMILFILVTGLSASIVRAALVSSLSLLAWYYGRKFKPLLVISFAAALTAAWNPFYEWSDIGWYLSFLAFFGVLLVAPTLVQLASRGHKPKTVGGLLGETIAAQIMTLPIIMYIFGRVSLIGLAANILVVPLVPIAMLLTLIAGLGGMLLVSLGGWVAWPANFLLTYMIDLTGLFSRLPHAAVQHTISLPSMLLGYSAILLIALGLWRLVVRKNYHNLVE